VIDRCAINSSPSAFVFLGAPLKGTGQAGIKKKVLKRILAPWRFKKPNGESGIVIGD
jgi:hypothetical protein